MVTRAIAAAAIAVAAFAAGRATAMRPEARSATVVADRVIVETVPVVQAPSAAAPHVDPVRATRTDSDDVGRRMLFSFARLAAGEDDPEDTLQAMARLSRLDPSMAPPFLERWRTERDPRVREAALTLALVCGGADVVTFVQDRIVCGTADERAAVLATLAGATGGVPIVPRRLPVDDPLAGIALQLLRSPDVTERLAATTLLASHRSERSSIALCALAESDADVAVRAAAIRALGHAGDREALVFVESYSLPRDAEARRVLSPALRAACCTLRRRLGSGF